jgi:hypothetical protein
MVMEFARSEFTLQKKSGGDCEAALSIDLQFIPAAGRRGGYRSGRSLERAD